MIEIRLFGGVEAHADDGTAIDVGPAKCQALLAALALSPGAAVPVDRLIELVWGIDPPRTAAKTLQTYVGRLRQGLGGTAIVRVGEAYRLDVDGSSVDVARFRAKLDAGDEGSALAEWSGPPFAGLDAPGLAPVADGLVEQHLAALASYLSARLDEPETVVTLRELTAEHRYREDLWELLLIALYRAGRQRDALAAYQELRGRLVEDLGVEPGPALRAVEARILAHDPDLGSGADRSTAAGPTRSSVDGRPGSRSRLIGRSRLLADVEEALDDAPLVTLVGPGGIGKTRLALAIAERWAGSGGGVDLDPLVVELGSISADAGVARVVAGAAGLAERPGHDVGDAVVRGLAGRTTLLVLDNCEHVVTGAAELAEAVLARCPGVTIVATSREPLGVLGEQVIEVAPLSIAGDAVELFVERARAVDRGFEVGADRASVVEICRRLDGLPLAIELAAARVRTFTPAELLARLDDRFRLLTVGRRTADARHQTLAAAVAWSYDLLSESERALLGRLAVFSGPFDLAAAEELGVGPVTGQPAIVDGTAVAGSLAGLVDRSMVVAELGPDGRRFRLLETIRAFAVGRLSAADHRDLADRHATWCRSEVLGVRTLVSGRGEVEGIRRLTELWPNLRAAVDHACTVGDHRLVRDLVEPIAPEVYLRTQSEVGEWAERLLAITPADDVDGIVFGLTWAARRYMRHGDPDGFARLDDRYGRPDDPMVDYARAFLADDGPARLRTAHRAMAQLEQRGDRYGALLFETVGLGGTLLAVGRLDEVGELLADVERRVVADGPPTILSWTLSMLGVVAVLRQRDDEADRYFARALEVEVPPRTTTLARPMLARAELKRDRPKVAFGLLDEHLEEVDDLDDMYSARLAGLTFLDVMVRVGRMCAGARVLGYLEASGLLDGPGLVEGVRGAIERIDKSSDASVAAARNEGRALDDRAAVAWMRSELAAAIAAG